MIFCVIDTETTGLKPDYHEIIQVAAILCDKEWREVDKISFKIKPALIERASKKALEINGYDKNTWDPKFFSHKKALQYLNNFIHKNNINEDTVIMVGQNIKFDYKFLEHAYRTCNLTFPFSIDSLDLIDIAKVWSSIKKVHIKKYSLGYLSEFTNQVNTKPHDAAADAEVTLDVLKWFINDLKKGNKHDRKRVRKHTSLKI